MLGMKNNEEVWDSSFWIVSRLPLSQFWKTPKCIEFIIRTFGVSLLDGFLSPFFIPCFMANMASGQVAMQFGVKGPNMCPVTACAAGTHAIGDAFRIIQWGEAEAMIAGGAEADISPIILAGLDALRVMSTRNEKPEKASRPWDKDRDGFVLSDGAGVVVLEEYEFAKARGANIYAEVIGFGMSGDAYHMTSPSKGGEGAARCMKMALKNAGINTEDVDYINAHGTSTPAGDLGETQALKSAFGDHAHKVAVSSTKSMTGHLLGAAGGIEAVFSALAIRDQVAPPTINLDNPGEGCDLLRDRYASEENVAQSPHRRGGTCCVPGVA